MLFGIGIQPILCTVFFGIRLNFERDIGMKINSFKPLKCLILVSCQTVFLYRITVILVFETPN